MELDASFERNVMLLRNVSVWACDPKRLYRAKLCITVEFNGFAIKIHWRVSSDN